jgi:hypothetical protein
MIVLLLAEIGLLGSGRSLVLIKKTKERKKGKKQNKESVSLDREGEGGKGNPLSVVVSNSTYPREGLWSCGVRPGWGGGRMKST